MEDDWKLHGDDTMRHLEAVAEQPGDLRYRLAIIHAIKDLRKEVSLTRIEMRAEFAKIEKRQLDLTDVARQVKKELKEDSGIGQLKVDVKRLWTAGVWFLSVVGAAILALAMSKIVGK